MADQPNVVVRYLWAVYELAKYAVQSFVAEIVKADDKRER
jgi:hypothetical protein